jgi:hypothetical protein
MYILIRLDLHYNVCYNVSISNILVFDEVL